MQFYFSDHSVACQSSAMINAVENLRDSDGMTSHDFRIALQQNDPLQSAESYLSVDSGMLPEMCKCHVWPMMRVMASIELHGDVRHAQSLAQAYLDNRQISVENYIALVKATEGR